MTSKHIEAVPTHEWDAIIGSVLKRFSALRYRDVLIDPDDLKQEAWMALLKASQDYDAKRNTKFTTFATMCIRFHLCKYITHKIGNKPGQHTYMPGVDVRITSTDGSPENNDLLDVIFDAVKDEPHYHLLIEHFMHEKSYRMIAREIGVSHTTIESRIHKLLEKLSVRIDGQNSEDD